LKIGGKLQDDNVEESAIYAQLTPIIREVLDDDAIEVTPGLCARDVDGWDSLSHIRLLLAVEKEFKIKFSTVEIGRLRTVGDLVGLISSRC
jgi:acyl carrier protein